tara:strand:+ start:12517 stop:12807 length:291 start_codon:yes stop_codon:yes gene_type:complete
MRVQIDNQLMLKIKQKGDKLPLINKVLKDIQVFLEPSFYNSIIKLESLNDHMILKVKTNKYISITEKIDMKCQINDIIKNYDKLELPVCINEHLND